MNINDVLQPGGIWSWLLIGLIAGFAANVVVSGRSSGCIGSIALGLIGAIIGGLIAEYFKWGIFHFWGSLLLAFIGACILIIPFKLFSGNRS
jgi:uncharacterized membrane protein YeaQ/YmgE (transglycosylase-associated protein family)